MIDGSSSEPSPSLNWVERFVRAIVDSNAWDRLNRGESPLATAPRTTPTP